MAEVAFHFNVPDKLAYACRLVRKVDRHELRVVVTGDDDQLQALDRMLWELEPTDFVGHCMADAEPAALAASRVVLAPDPATCVHRDVLVNLGWELPPLHAVFQRVIEVVSQDDEADRRHARQRWKRYAAGGHAIVRFDLAAMPETR